MKKFLIIDSTILPSVYEKVVEAKEMLRTGKAKAPAQPQSHAGAILRMRTGERDAYQNQ